MKRLLSVPVLGLVFLSLIAVVLLFVARHRQTTVLQPVIIPLVDADTDGDNGIMFSDHTKIKFLPEPKNHPPPVIVVGPFHWRIRYADLGEKLYGATDNFHLQIIVNPKVPLDQFKETVVHELFHACIYLGNDGSSGTNLGNDDTFIEATAPAFLFVLEKNPELVRWLQQKDF